MRRPEVILHVNETTERFLARVHKEGCHLEVKEEGMKGPDDRPELLLWCEELF